MLRNYYNELMCTLIYTHAHTVSYWYYYCIGYASNDWSTSEVPLDKYQEELNLRRTEEALHKGIYTHIYHVYYTICGRELALWLYVCHYPHVDISSKGIVVILCGCVSVCTLALPDPPSVPLGGTEGGSGYMRLVCVCVCAFSVLWKSCFLSIGMLIVLLWGSKSWQILVEESSTYISLVLKKWNFLFCLCITLEFHFEAVRQQHHTFYSHRYSSTAGKSLFLLSCC